MSNTIDPVRPMHDPPHPGEILREGYLEPLHLSVTEAARALGVSRTALSQFLNGHARLSPDMARRLAAAFRTSVEFWLNLQHNRDVWLARKDKKRVDVKPLVPKRAALG
jgi:addiction module HigA family antidote